MNIKEVIDALRCGRVVIRRVGDSCICYERDYTCNSISSNWKQTQEEKECKDWIII